MAPPGCGWQLWASPLELSLWVYLHCCSGASIVPLCPLTPHILPHKLHVACCLWVGLSPGPDKPRVDLGGSCSLVVQVAPGENCG